LHIDLGLVYFLGKEFDPEASGIFWIKGARRWFDRVFL
jgi:hypothetical protein